MKITLIKHNKLFSFMRNHRMSLKLIFIKSKMAAIWTPWDTIWSWEHQNSWTRQYNDYKNVGWKIYPWGAWGPYLPTRLVPIPSRNIIHLHTYPIWESFCSLASVETSSNTFLAILWHKIDGKQTTFTLLTSLIHLLASLYRVSHKFSLL